MVASYSEDLRRKMVQACERGTQSQRAVAEFFNVSRSFVEARLSHYRRSGGALVRQRHKYGRHVLLEDACREQLRQWLQEQPGLILKELIGRLQASAGMVVSEPTLCSGGCTGWVCTEKKTVHAAEGTQRAYAWHVVGTASKSQSIQSTG